MRLKRMVRGVAAVILQSHAIPLRAGHDEILRETSIEQKTTGLSGKRRVRVDKVRKPSHRAIGEEGLRGRVSPERLRRGQRCTVDNADSRDVDAIKDLIHQRNVVLAGTNRKERIQHSVRLNINVIELVSEKNF